MTTHTRLNPVVSGLLQSATLALNERAAELEAAGTRVFRLGFGESPFPVPETVVEALRLNAHQKAYLPVRGLRDLRTAVAEYQSARTGLDFSADDVVIGPGSKELMYILQVVFNGRLNIPAPSWLSYAPHALLSGKQLQWIETDAESDWLLTPDQLDQIGHSAGDLTQMVILNYPANPAGTTYDREQLRDLAEAARRHGLLILSDEIYGELHHRGEHASIASFYPEGTIISSGLSKWCSAGGWRLGTFVFPRQLADILTGVVAVASESYSSTSAPIQYAAISAYRGGSEIEGFLDKSRRILRAVAATVTERLRNAGASVCEPSGGYYIMPDFGLHREAFAERGIATAPDFCERVLTDAGVALLPGSAFGRPRTEFSVRLAYVDFNGARALDALSVGADPDTSFLQEFCRPTLEGVDRICEFVSAASSS